MCQPGSGIVRLYQSFWIVVWVVEIGYLLKNCKVVPTSGIHIFSFLQEAYLDGYFVGIRVLFIYIRSMESTTYLLFGKG